MTLSRLFRAGRPFAASRTLARALATAAVSAAALMAFGVSAAHAQTGDLFLSPTTTEAVMGDIITFDVYATGIQGALGYSTAFSIDTNYLAFIPNFGGGTSPYKNAAGSFFELGVTNALQDGGSTLNVSFADFDSGTTDGLQENGQVLLGQFQVQVVQDLTGIPGAVITVALPTDDGEPTSVQNVDGINLVDNVNGAIITGPAAAVPEAGTAVLFGLAAVGAGGFGIVRRRRAVSAAATA